MTHKLKQFYETFKHNRRIKKIRINPYIIRSVKLLQIDYENGINITLDKIREEKENLKKTQEKFGFCPVILCSFVALEGLRLKVLLQNK